MLKLPPALLSSSPSAGNDFSFNWLEDGACALFKIQKSNSIYWSLLFLHLLGWRLETSVLGHGLTGQINF